MMTLVKWNPRRSLFNLSDDLFDGFFNANNYLPRSRENWMPAVDIDENDNAYTPQCADRLGQDRKLSPTPNRSRGLNFDQP